MQPASKQYFPAIDGLRALAVLAVIFFHLELSLFQGGYIGVDVFFVISGYLITRNILIAINQGQFSFKQFYLARIRRLMPAMLATLSLTLLFGVLLLSPHALIRLSESAIASALSLANIRFWQISGYFDIGASRQPLLHFWSLSVEEQFYLFWPCVLVLLLKFSNSKIKGGVILFVLAILSFCGAQYMVNNFPSTAFYWVQFRAYEFAFGALLVWYEHYFQSVDTKLKKSSNVLCILGLILLAISATYYSKATPFPGYASLLPCFAAFLLIYSRESRAAHYLLANRLMVFIGSISYSLYLVHWPIWVFLSHWRFAEFSLSEKIGIFFLMLFVGYCLYQLIEKRFRYASKNNTEIRRDRTFYSFLTLAIILLIGVSWLIRSQSGWPSRITNRYSALEPAKIECKHINGKQFQDCIFGDRNIGHPKVLLIGDSHSINLRYGLDKFGRAHSINFRSVSFAGCPPLFDLQLHYSSAFKTDNVCLDLMKKVAEILNTSQYDAVVISARWEWLYEHRPYSSKAKLVSAYLAGDRSNDVMSETSRRVWKSALTNTLDVLQRSVDKVVLVSQYPVLQRGIGECDKSPVYFIPKSRHQSRCQVQISYEDVMAHLYFTNTVIESLAGDNVMIIKPSDVICDDEKKTCSVFTDKGLLYQDDNHLSNLGSDVLINAVSKKLVDFLK